MSHKHDSSCVDRDDNVLDDREGMTSADADRGAREVQVPISDCPLRGWGHLEQRHGHLCSRCRHATWDHLESVVNGRMAYPCEVTGCSCSSYEVSL